MKTGYNNDLFIALKTSMSSLVANQSQLALTSNNIANLNKEGYTRKVLEQETVILNGTSLGLKAEAVTRQVDQFLVREIDTVASKLQALKAKDIYLGRLQALFASPSQDGTLGPKIAQFTKALISISDTPEHRQQLVDKADNLCRYFNGISGDIQTMRQEIDQAIADKVGQVNHKLNLIASLNTQIIRNTTLGNSTAELEDQRDTAIRFIADHLDIRTISRSDGSVVISLGSGKNLVDGFYCENLHHDAVNGMTIDNTHANGAIGGLFVGTVLPNNDVTTSLEGGQIKGLIELRDQILPKLAEDIEKLAITFRNSMNEIHNQGTAFVPPQQLSGTRYFADPAVDQVTTSTDVRFAVVNNQGGFVSTYTLPAGTYTVNQIRDLVAANVPGIAASTATGNLTLSHGAHRIAIRDLGNQIVTFNASNFNGFSYFFGLNDLFVDNTNISAGVPSVVAGTMRLRPDIKQDASYIAHGQLNDPGVTSLAISPSDNRTFLAMLNALQSNASIPGTLTFTSNGSVPFSRSLQGNMPTSTLHFEAYANGFMGFQATQTAYNTEQIGLQTSYFQALDNQFKGQSGVNLDEELSNLIIYQRSYAASARVIDTISNMLDTLISIS